MKMFARNPKQKRLKTIFWVYLSFIILVSILPINGEEGVLNNNYTFNIRWDYMLHSLAYIPIPILIKTLVKPYWQVILISSLIAVALESLQLLLPFRTFNTNDLMANVIGVVIGIILGVIMRGVKRGRLI